MIWRQWVRWAAVSAALWLGLDPVLAEQRGIAAVYSYRGGKTSSGERSNPSALTAAHRSLPFGTKVQVTNHGNGRTVVVRINDRGPAEKYQEKGVIIDVSEQAAKELGFKHDGKASVKTEVVAQPENTGK